jgi:DNA-binding GntR family transcriptional regulator
VILLTALTEEQWVEEDDFARKLNLPAKMVRKALRYLEQV